MNTRPPLQEGFGSIGWSNFFTQLFQAVGWIKAWSFQFNIDFPSIPANSQSAAANVSMPGVRQGDSVCVTPFYDISGIFFKGVVTSDDTVSIFAMNCTGIAINPIPMKFRVFVIQN